MKKKSYTKLSLKKLGRTIKNSPLQFLAMILILTLATTLFSGLYASYLSLDNRISEFYEKSNMADIWTTTFRPSSSELTPEERERDYNDIVNATKDYGGTIETRYYNQANIDGQSTYICLSDNYPTISIPYETNNTEKNDFFVVDRRFASEGVVDVQLQISIVELKTFINENDGKIKNILNEHLKEGKKINIFDSDTVSFTATPTGEMMHPENVLKNKNLSAPIFLISRSYLNKQLTKVIEENFEDWTPKPGDEDEKAAHDLLINPKGEIIDKYYYSNQYLTRLTNRQLAVEAKDKISGIFNKRPTADNDLLLNTDLNSLESNKNLTADLIQAQQMSFVLPSFFFLVAILVVTTTISQIILKERNEIGTLKALGASTRSIIIHYLLLGISIGLIGVVLGLIIGPLVLPIVMQLKYQLIYMLPSSHFIFPTVASIILTIVIIVVISLVVYLITKKEAKQLPSVTMRQKVAKKNKHFLKSTVINKDKNNTHKLCLKMALRNIFISSTRSLMVILGVLGCTGLLCSGYGINDAIDYGLYHDLDCYFNADAMVYFSSGNEETIKEVEKLVEDKLITAYEPLSLLPTSSYKVGYKDTSFATQIYSLCTYTYQENNFISTGDFKVHNTRVAITTKVANKLNIGVGDYINFAFLGKQYTGLVGKVLESFYIQGIFIDGTYPPYPSCITSPTVYVRYHPDADRTTILKRIEAIKGVSLIREYEVFKASSENDIASLKLVTLVVKMFAILLAAIVLYNLALLNFKENIRNIATMKVLGFTRREIGESLVMEIMILTIVGIIFGLAIGFPLEILILSLNKTPFNEFIYYISPLTFLYSFLITVFVSLVINVYLGLKSKKVKMVESLKSIE